MSSTESEFTRWFADEVLPHEAALRTWLGSRFPSLRDRDDVVQEAYARLLRTRATGPIACPRAFLFVTARNLALNHLRHQRLERPAVLPDSEPIEIADGSAGIPEALANAEELRVLVTAISTLPERCRQIVTLRKIYGLSQREVAERLGISENTVESQGAIGLQKCISYFRRHGYGRGPQR